MFIDRRYFRYFDWLSLLLILLITGIGLFFVFSTTYKPDQPYSLFFKKQLLGIISGIFIYLLLSASNYKTIMRWGYFCYFIVIALLLFTIIKGSIGMGAQRWINMFFFKAQPSELAKLLFPLFATYYFYTQKDTFEYSYKDFAPILSILGISFVLILKQPDLGTALILLFSGLLIVWFAGIDKKFFLYGSLIFLLSAPLSWYLLKPYQKNRVMVFLGYGDSKKERYQIEQSKIAVGSGGLTGKGFLQGTQNKLSFLPESRTDFIFSVIGEEIGFLGTFISLFLYALLFLHLCTIIQTITIPLTQLLSFGLIIHIMISTLINICMVLGLLPTVGIPLPFMSYGISHTWITFASLGLFNSIAIRRFYIGE